MYKFILHIVYKITIVYILYLYTPLFYAGEDLVCLAGWCWCSSYWNIFIMLLSCHYLYHFNYHIIILIIMSLLSRVMLVLVILEHIYLFKRQKDKNTKGQKDQKESFILWCQGSFAHFWYFNVISFLLPFHTKFEEAYLPLYIGISTSSYFLISSLAITTMLFMFK